MFSAAMLVSFLLVNPVYAVARAPFPSATRLQPIPPSEAATPNVSGNVQSTGAVPSVYNTSPEGEATSNAAEDSVSASSDQVPDSSTTPTQQGNILVIFAFVLLVLAAGSAFFLFRKDSSSDTV